MVLIADPLGFIEGICFFWYIRFLVRGKVCVGEGDLEVGG